MPKLSKAVNDADAIGRALTEAGFKVTVKRNTDRRELFDGLLGFVESIQGGDEVVFFFAGHGVQIDSASYLLPADFKATSEKQVTVDALALQYVMDQLQEAKAAFSLVIIDACRDNPLPKTAGRSIGATRGLTPTQPPVGQMVVYSAGKGQTALDRLTVDPRLDPDPNSIFTREFLKRIKRRGVPVKDLLEVLQQSVEDLAATVRHSQRPAVYSEARGRFYFFAGPANVTVNAAASPPSATAPVDVEREIWEGARSIDTIDAYQGYLADYPNGRSAKLANAQIGKLKQPAQVAGLVVRPESQGQPPAQAVPAARPAGATAAVADRQAFRDCADCPELVVIPAGRFQMGSPSHEEGRFDNEGPLHEVQVNRFALGKYEVTRGEYAAFVRDTARGDGDGCFTDADGKWEKRAGRSWRDPGFTQTDQHPVVCVSWEDAQAYATWLARETGKGYRLASEAEWEYTARAGTTTARYWGKRADDACRYANVGDRITKAQVPDWKFPIHDCDDGAAYTAPAGRYLANAFGLHDILGNVWEWVQDCWNETYAGAPTDGSAWSTGDCSKRVDRGGGWDDEPRGVRSAGRSWLEPSLRNLNLGFRIARTLP